MPTIFSLVTTRHLNRNMRGADVVTLQRALGTLGHTLLPDGDFGSITDLAVKSFQTANNLTADGIVGPKTAHVMDMVLGVAQPAPTPADPIYVDLMYGLGDASTSAGMDVLAASLRALSPRLVVAPTVSWTQRDALASRINARRTKRNMLFGNSMGANAIPMVTNACLGVKFDLIGGYDPTIWWSCPAFGTNVVHGINYHGTNWLNPIGHARYSEAFPGQIEVVPTSTLHQNVDDNLALHRHTIDVVKQRVSA